MSEPNSRQAEVFRFGDCVLDTAARELHRNGAAAAIEPRAFDLLVYLIRNRKRTIAKDELLDVLWAGSVVSETSLPRCVMKARKAVGDSAGDGQVINTMPRHGYRFVAAVDPEAQQPAAEAAPPGDTTVALERPAAPSVVVLPFAVLGSSAETAMLADGLTEDIITDLSQNGWLFVIARKSLSAYNGWQPPVDHARTCPCRAWRLQGGAPRGKTRSSAGDRRAAIRIPEILSLHRPRPGTGRGTLGSARACLGRVSCRDRCER